MKGRPSSGNLRLFDDLKFRLKESPMKTYYVGMDVHRARIVIAVLDGSGKVVFLIARRRAGITEQKNR